MSEKDVQLETDPRFPSGEWKGFYIQWGKRARMELLLTFTDGVFRGEGRDGIGVFGIKGRYVLESGRVTFHKHYVAGHTVTYAGWNEGKGIWGTWELPGDRGGFHIWPREQAEGIERELSESTGVTAEIKTVLVD